MLAGCRRDRHRAELNPLRLSRERQNFQRMSADPGSGAAWRKPSIQIYRQRKDFCLGGDGARGLLYFDECRTAFSSPPGLSESSSINTHSAQRRKSRAPLVPPKPNELDMAYSTSALLA